MQNLSWLLLLIPAAIFYLLADFKGLNKMAWAMGGIVIPSTGFLIGSFIASMLVDPKRDFVSSWPAAMTIGVSGGAVALTFFVIALLVLFRLAPKKKYRSFEDLVDHNDHL